MQAVFSHISGVKRGQRETVADDRITVGRAPTNVLAFAPTDTRASAHHAEIVREDDTYVLRDAGSTNGTFVNGQRVYHARLKSGDVIEFGTGGPKVQFSMESDAGAPIGDFLPRTETLSTATVASAAAAARATDKDKEYGRTTMRLMVDYAVKKSSTQFRLLVSILSFLVVALTALTGYFAYLTYIGQQQPTDFRLIARENQGAVVFISVRYMLIDERGQGVEEYVSNGSGFVVSPEGYIVSNRHVVHLWEFDPQQSKKNYKGDIRDVKVLFADHNPNDAIPAEIVRLSEDPNADIAILKVKPFDGMPVLTKFNTDTSTLSQGDLVAVIGYPLGADLFQFTKATKAETSFSQGVISKITEDKIQIDAAAYPGNSGGPIFDEHGRVIGILTQGLGTMGAQNINFGTPIGVALKLLQSDT
jgi:S1-C subfamily serine protease